MKLSIIIPMHNEAENVEPLVREIDAACAEIADIELILVDDGSKDETAALIKGLQAEFDWLRLVQHAKVGGQSAAVHNGVLAARGEVCCTLDGDMQNPPSEIPKLVAPLMSVDTPENLGLVAGQRVGRQDTWAKRYASKFANGLRAWMLNDKTRDTGCGLKAFRRDAFVDLPFFNHMHRYLPALFGRDGWEIQHIDVSHRERGGGSSKYNNLQRAMVGMRDLFGVAWLIRRKKTARPVEYVPGEDKESRA